jgi:hypothetical protein
MVSTIIAPRTPYTNILGAIVLGFGNRQMVCFEHQSRRDSNTSHPHDGTEVHHSELNSALTM